MDQNIINQYNLLFTDKIMRLRGHKPYIVKVAASNRMYLTEFLTDWDSIEDIDEYLLPGISDVLNNTLPEHETGSDMFSVIIGPITTVFYTEIEGSSYPSIPTQDFKEILLGWKLFLSTPPLNRSEV